MTHFWADTGDEAYVILLNQLLDFPDHVVSPRGQRTYEVLDTTITIYDPVLATPNGARSGMNLKIAVSELVQLIAGVSSLSALDAVSNGRFSQFADDGRLMGAYGPRLYDQLPVVEAKLREDQDSRQAVAVLWEHHELDQPVRDLPCTLSLTFRIRDRKLGLKVHMRSNDAILGVPYDWFVFSRVQLLMAEVLGLKPGPYVHHVDSLHLYERDVDRATTFVANGHDRAQALPVFTGGDVPLRNWCAAQSAAWSLLVTPERNVPVELRWFYQRLVSISNAGAGTEGFCEVCRYVLPADQFVGNNPNCVGCDP